MPDLMADTDYEEDEGSLSDDDSDELHDIMYYYLPNSNSSKD